MKFAKLFITIYYGYVIETKPENLGVIELTENTHQMLRFGVFNGVRCQTTCY